jgi:amidase
MITTAVNLRGGELAMAGTDWRKTVISANVSRGWSSRLFLETLEPWALVMTETPSSHPAAHWAYRSAGDLAQSLLKKEVSALELTDQFIARIEALDGDLNAVPVRDFTRAREAAKEADAALARGERQPLLGVPVTIKESYNVAGLPTTWGIPEARDFVPKEDALAVARLKRAGVVILGKTNVPFVLGDWQSYNDIHGATNNPWDRTRTPGGSSGGSSAALAAGFGPLSLGSDIGGSLRVPAHFCGVCAHKPTHGIVASRGHVPPGLPALPGGVDLAVIGPMARSVDDLILTLDTIAGPDETADGRAYRLSLPAARHDKLADFRVLFIAEHPLLPTSPEVGASLELLAKRLTAAGVDVQRETPPLPDLAASALLYVKLLNAVISARLPEDRYQEIRAAIEKIPADDQSLVAELARGAAMSHREWQRADFARQRLKQQWRALFREFDVVICPPAATPAFRHDPSMPQETRKIDVGGKEFPYLHLLVWAELATTCGLPATVIPIGVTDTLPIGVQIIGPEFEDRTPLAFARAIEREFGGFTAPPGYA